LKASSPPENRDSFFTFSIFSSPEVKKEVVIKEYKPEIKVEQPAKNENVKKLSRFSGGLEAFKKARAMSPSNLPKVDPDAPLGHD
jgi:hypothetical protein